MNVSQGVPVMLTQQQTMAQSLDVQQILALHASTFQMEYVALHVLASDIDTLLSVHVQV